MVEEIKEKINRLDANDFASLENLDLIKEINDLTNEEDKKEVSDYLAARIKEVTDASDNKDTDFNIVSNGNDEEIELEEEFNRINSLITELENEFGVFDANKKIDDEIKRIEQEKTDTQEKLEQKNKELQEKRIQFDGYSDDVINKLNDELKALQDKKNLIYPQAHLFGRQEQVKQLEEVNSLISAKKTEIQKIKMEKNKKIELNSRLEELKKSLTNLKEEDFLEEAKRQVNNMSLREQNENFVNRVVKSLYLRTKKNIEDDIKNTETEIIKIENMGFVKHLENKLSSLKEEDFLDEAKRQATSMNLRGPQTDEYVKRLTNSLYLRTKKSIEAEILEYKNGSKSVLELGKNEISELEDKLSTVSSKLNKLNELKKLKETKKELETKRNKKTDKIIRKEHRKDLWYKGIAATAGVALGLSLSSVPGVGAIRMMASGAKLATSGINVWTKKHPEGKIAKMINGTKESFKENYPNIANKIINIKDKLGKVLAKEKVNYFINGVAAGYMAGNILEMVTGKTVGEHLGNLFSNGENAELTTNVISDSVSNTVTNNTPNKKVPINKKPVRLSDNISNNMPNNVTNTIDIGSNIMTSVSNITLEPGSVYDISGLTKGLVSSDSKKMVNLITSAGKEAVVDKFVTLPNGEVMVHFKQINGDGYAWFKEAVVKDYLAKISEATIKSGRSM